MRYLVFWIGDEVYRIKTDKVLSIIKTDKYFSLPFKDTFTILHRGKPYISVSGEPKRYAIILRDDFFIFCDRVEGVVEGEEVFNGKIPKDFELNVEFKPLINFKVSPVEFKTEVREEKGKGGKVFLIFAGDMGYMAFDINDIISVDDELKEEENIIHLTNFPKYSIKVEQDGKIYNVWVLNILDFVEVESIKVSKNPMFKEVFEIKNQKIGVPNLKFLEDKDNLKFIVDALEKMLKDLDLPEIREAYEKLSKLIRNE
mgnify:CR=1 FL=1